MLFIPLYIFLYCNIEKILQKIYLSNYTHILSNELITDNPYFYYFITNMSIFILGSYLLFVLKQTIFQNKMNTYSFTLALVYIKYLLDILLNDNMKLYEYEFSRNIMWLFSTPLLLKMYCQSNNLKMSTDIKTHYHIIPITINIFIYPYKNTQIYYIYVAISCVSIGLFMKTLYAKRKYFFTNIFLLVWIIYMSINILEMLNKVDKYTINIFYLCADTIGKMTSNIIINDYIDREDTIKNSNDLQCIHFTSYLIDNINKYSIENSKITNICKDYIDLIKSRLNSKIPENKEFLKRELLEKILPLGFDNQYIKSDSLNIIPKQYDMICVLFTDIVNYTQLSKQYDDKIIFKLLNNVYVNFDNIIKKYSHLQKIETIGDAYMVVGDIYRNKNNHKEVIKETILLSIEFINEIKLIKTPDEIPLSIRIGINMGKVSIGILGNEIPRLCVVGNTVNVAARLQSTADINCIQMSRHIHEKIGEIDFNTSFNIITKDGVFLKNIGSVQTYNIYPK